MITSWLVGIIAVALVAANPGVGVAPIGTTAGQLQGRDLLEALRGGGYVILFRHAATDRGQRDADLHNLANCETQRNLSDEGRRQAAAIGQAFRQLQIPVAAVLASPYCRTLETAQLAFERAEPSNDLISELSDPEPGSRERLAAALRAFLARTPEPGTNTVLVTHVLNIDSALGFEIDEGEAIVAGPDGAGGYTIVGRVLSEGWPPLEGSSTEGEPTSPVQ